MYQEHLIEHKEEELGQEAFQAEEHIVDLDKKKNLKIEQETIVELPGGGAPDGGGV